MATQTSTARNELESYQKRPVKKLKELMPKDRTTTVDELTRMFEGMSARDFIRVVLSNILKYRKVRRRSNKRSIPTGSTRWQDGMTIRKLAVMTRKVIEQEGDCVKKKFRLQAFQRYAQSCK